MTDQKRDFSTHGYTAGLLLFAFLCVPGSAAAQVPDFAPKIVAGSPCVQYNDKQQPIIFSATDNITAQTNIALNNWGFGTITSGAQPPPEEVTYTFCTNASSTAWYKLSIRYATNDRRPVMITWNGTVLGTSLLGNSRGGFDMSLQRWEFVEYVHLQATNTLTIHRDGGPLPHINTIMLEPISPAQ